MLSCRDALSQLDPETANLRTQGEQHELLNLPRTLANLENKIQTVADQLGSQEFRALTGTSGEFSNYVNHQTTLQSAYFKYLNNTIFRQSSKTFDVDTNCQGKVVCSKG